MGWADIKRNVRARLGEPTPGYWSDKELQDWYNEGVALQHRFIFQAALKLEDRSLGDMIEGDYLRDWIVKAISVFVAGTQDYALPNFTTVYFRVVRATVTIDGVECQADFVPFADDWDVRNLPHKAPSPNRPKYSLVPGGYIRFYVTPGLATVPNSTSAYAVYSLVQPVAVTIEDGGAVDTQLTKLQFNIAPTEFILYRAMRKQYDSQAADAYLNAAQQAMQALITGPSKEAAELKAS